ncbi:hypothetical protein BAC1_00082 [uncultured bacterium]|nr:hypothetical protein BAC1_00082 [uncultured bacterium]
MKNDDKLALFIMLGQTATKNMKSTPEIAHPEPLLISDIFDLSSLMPESVREANNAAISYKLFFVFENYLREFVVDVLSKNGKESWWEKIPSDIQKEVADIVDNEEIKSWMALGSRDKSALLTYPQLLKIIEHSWKNYFEELVRDRALIQEARHITHLRNTICHMSNINTEELGRLKQVMRDWFRMVSP